MGDKASKAADGVVAPVPPLAMVTVPVTLVALPVTVPVTFPVRLAVMVPAEKLPEASRLTMVEAVLALVAAVVSLTEVAILAAVLDPTVATVGLGKLPLKSPPAAPVGAIPETQCYEPL
jgi:hypothetical protein